ncbi:MAG: hypothetical protein K0U24_02655 [Gammaproteobacteria bacterium]|nr:hypothetical protein [Gammaproteobacteria bacterium]
MTKNTLADYTIKGEIKVYQECLVELQDVFPKQKFAESDFAYLNRLEKAFDSIVDDSPRARPFYVSVRNHDIYAEEEAIGAKR